MLDTYEALREYRDMRLQSALYGHKELHALHDRLITRTFRLARRQVAKEQGDPPAPFAFYLMGSAGRGEQSVWSDQDHGILFSGEDHLQGYFLRLGEEVSRGLEVVGYDRCEGEVMASNPLWCQSTVRFKEQIRSWLEAEDWQTLRHFTIFFDSRVLHGDPVLLEEVKAHAFSQLHKAPHLYKRLYENMEFMKKGTGVFGQLLTEQTGEGKGKINVKETVYFPYVNALRILALCEGIYPPSTLERFRALLSYYPSLSEYEDDFRKLLEYRIQWGRDADHYENVHLISPSILDKEEKRLLKRWMKHGKQLVSETRHHIRGGG
ncbi:DUF294 nucleotidyltransferase-like domain-containing protein [Halobacillus sp. KGW1]|uniref:DUF294 nucleotidyltransferase-like domain-containing protein n=1 Tax=Halobacillus sp. KGW1 TaxID=1793726 RepID=UPI000785F3C0|nr:DUF294 nucleotidyltransferase-like domain-containing protein [Halobacillus sp. KGW1]